MKRYNLHTLLVLIGLLLLNACTQEDLLPKKETVAEGIPTTVKLGFNASAQDKIETRAGEDESATESKVKDISVFIFDKNGNFSKIHSQTYVDGVNQKGSIDIGIFSGEYYMFAIANMQSSALYGDDFKTELLNFKGTKDDFLQLSATMKQETTTLSDGLFVMTGCYQAAEGSENKGQGYCVIPPTGTFSASISLVRLVGSITFDITSAVPNGLFTPTEWTVINVPKITFLYGGDTDAESGYFDTDAFGFNANPSSPEKTSITFYMTENRKSATSDIPKFNDRESETYYPKNSTYLKLKGSYTGPGKKDSGTSDVTAQVTYYIHLGYVDKNLNDFASKRNTKYTYKVQVVGINDIIVEVEEVNTPYHPGDGDVTYHDGGTMINVDAHYEAKVLTFDRSTLPENGELYNFLVRSPKTGWQFIKDDYDWVKFKKNADSSTDPQSYCPTDLMDIENLLTDLHTEKNVNGGVGSVSYTCFIEEYWYGGDWTEFVNKDNRELMILCNTKSGNGSSLTDASFVISQKSIQTVYSLDNKLNAWGIEWVNESGAIYYGPDNNVDNAWGDPSLTAGTNTEFGRPNMITEMGDNLSWESPDIKDKAYIACMSRNRDENGNGKIDDEEIKWYLPTINQYQYIWLGIDGIDNRARLFNKKEYGFMHYFSNSPGRRIFWAEEGGSTSAWGEYNDASGQFDPGKRQIRCARNLKDITEAPDPLIIKSVDNKYDVSRLNAKSLRQSYVSGELPNHFETYENNRPYRGGFEVYPVLLGQEKTLSEYKEKSPCPRGWRIPNQREYSIYDAMLGGTSNGDKVVTRTNFSYELAEGGYTASPANLNNTTRSFFFQKGGMGVSRGGDKGLVRCVKDYK